jgi:hypothetical protein
MVSEQREPSLLAGPISAIDRSDANWNKSRDEPTTRLSHCSRRCGSGSELLLYVGGWNELTRD